MPNIRDRTVHQHFQAAVIRGNRIPTHCHLDLNKPAAKVFEGGQVTHINLILGHG
jgi:hypothetical protein